MDGMDSSLIEFAVDGRDTETQLHLVYYFGTARNDRDGN
jgi:hypothetical protein